MLSTLRKQMKILKNKSRFIQWISSGQINLLNKTKVQVKEILEKNNFDGNPQHEEEEGELKSAPKNNKFGYLLNMPIWSLSQETMEEYRRLAEQKEGEVRRLEETTTEEMWLIDLGVFENSYKESLKNEKFKGTFSHEPKHEQNKKKRPEQIAAKIVIQKQPKEASKKQTESAKKGILGKRKREESSSDSFINDDSESSDYPEPKKKKKTRKIESSESNESSFNEKTKKKRKTGKSKKLIDDECSSASDIDSDSIDNNSKDSFINDDDSLSEDSSKPTTVITKKKKVQRKICSDSSDSEEAYVPTPKKSEADPIRRVFEVKPEQLKPAAVEEKYDSLTERIKNKGLEFMKTEKKDAPAKIADEFMKEVDAYQVNQQVKA